MNESLYWLAGLLLLTGAAIRLAIWHIERQPIYEDLQED